MANIKIIYIASDKHYASMFDKWVRNIECFAQEDIKNVVLLTNEDVDISKYNLQNVTITKYHIMHFPWPMMALFKFHLIYNHINEHDDFVFYFNANFMPYPSLNIDRFTDDTLYLFRSNKKYEHKIWEEKNPYNQSIKYVVSGIIGGTYQRIKECCEFIIDHINNLLVQCTIEYKHDESALNHYVDHLYQTGGDFTILDFEDIGELDCSLHENGDKEYHRKNVTKYVLE